LIRPGLETILEVGAALQEIHDAMSERLSERSEFGSQFAKLYRETHGTFEGYCRDKWGMAGRSMHQDIHVQEPRYHPDDNQNLAAQRKNVPQPALPFGPLRELGEGFGHQDHGEARKCQHRPAYALLE
jgi:hypothetical protein